jgi:hypothetical protein
MGSTKFNECNLPQKVAIPAVAAAAPYKGGCKNNAYAPVVTRPGKIPPRDRLTRRNSIFSAADPVSRPVEAATVQFAQCILLNAPLLAPENKLPFHFCSSS